MPCHFTLSIHNCWSVIVLWCSQTNGEIYEALRTIAACYVRADMTGICDCITAYKLTDVLSKATRLKCVQQALMDGCHKENPSDKPGKSCHDAVSMVQSHQVHVHILLSVFCCLDIGCALSALTPVLKQCYLMQMSIS